MDNFPDALDRLISKWKGMGCTAEELIRDLRMAALALDDGSLTQVDQNEVLDGN